jgi:hypothetical protein
MKLTLALALILLTGNLYAQRLTGILMGEVTRLPLAHATIAAAGTATLSNAYGMFSINAKTTDSIRISCAGYSYYAFKPVKINPRDTIVIYLKPVAYNLAEVKIKANRDFKAESLQMRKDFASVYAYKPPKATDAIKRINPYLDIPYDYINARNSTVSDVSVNVLQLINFFNKKKDHTSKLQQTLLKQESENYMTGIFSKEKVQQATGLKGDSLKIFMDRYRPGMAQLKKMSDYELMTYIRGCYVEFKSPVRH